MKNSPFVSGLTIIVIRKQLRLGIEIVAHIPIVSDTFQSDFSYFSDVTQMIFTFNFLVVLEKKNKDLKRSFLY